MSRFRSVRAAVMIVVTTLVASLLSVVLATAGASSAQAANVALFNPGNIISDALFYDGGAMSATDVQSFLQANEGTCSGSVPCLKNYAQSTPTMPADSLCPAAYVGSASDRAADIIAKVGAACGISQRALLVTLQKEQSLVTSTAPTVYAYTHATGFACPDSAPCNPAYSGFFYQVYYAAHQFQNYRQNPTSFNYIAGRTNYILYSPNCSTRVPVFIQNAATAGLYDYTPYTPDPALLAGGSDGCSSYGNLNFWKYFTDWFGPTTAGTSLLRTVDNGTVYLVSGTAKYPVPSIQSLTALSPLGPVGYVSQSYLDTLTTSHVVGHALRGPDGTVYFFDSGIKLPFTSCAQMADYGATNCAPDGYVQLSQTQIDTFYTGPALSSVMGTVEGARYYIHGGTKSEILDDQSQAAAGIPPGMNVLTENAVSYLPLATPITRDGVFVTARGGASTSLLSGGKTYSVATGSEAVVGESGRTAGSLWPASIALIPSGGTFSGLISTPDGATKVIAADGLYALSAGGASSTAPTPVSSAFAASYTSQGTIAAGSFIMSPASGTVYIVMATQILPIASWDALLALTPPGQPVRIITVSQPLISALTAGPVALQSGTLVRSPSNATVYFMNGVTDKIAFSSFVFPVEAGFNNLVFADQSRLDAYPIDANLMGFGFQCNTTDYVGAGGQVHAVDPSSVPLYPFTWVKLDPFVCAQLKVGTPATSFIRTPDGSIYQLSGGKKLPIATMARFLQLSGGQAWLNVVPEFAAAIPTGPLA